MFFSRKKKHSENPSTPYSVPVSGLASSQSQPVHPWSAHAPPIGKSPSPFPREGLTLSLSTSAGKMLLFGGWVQDSSTRRITNDLFVISTRNFSTTLLQTSGDIPSPRYGHCAMLISTGLLIWGGMKQNHDQVFDDIYLFNLVLRKWTRIVVDGPGPCGRSHHTMTLVGSKIFVFGGTFFFNKLSNDIWALDLNCLESNPFWESYEPAPGSKKPHPRSHHVSVTIGDYIIIFGGYGGLLRGPNDTWLNDTWLNDTWSFNISTRKWTELKCTGSIPSPRAGHAAVLIDNLMYVFGGHSGSAALLGDLSAFNLSTHRWITFQDIGPSPSRRTRHAMVCDGTRIFVLGGELSQDEQDETKLIHVLDTKRLEFPEPDSDVINPSEKTAQLVQKSSTSPPTQGQAHQLSYSSDAKNPSLKYLPSRSTGASEHPTKPVAPDTSSEKEIAQLENGRLIDALAHGAEEKKRAEQELYNLQMRFDDLLLSRDQTEANAAEVKKHAGLEQRKLQTKLDDRDRRIGRLTDELAQAAEEKKRAGRELRELQTKLDASLLSGAHTLERAEASAAEEKRRAALELRELQVKFDRLLLSRDQAEANAVEVKWRAEMEQRELQAKLDELILSRDEHLHMFEQAQSALQEATSRAADAAGRSHLACEHETEVAELRAKLEGKKSELAAVRFRLTDQDGWAKVKAKADKLHTVTAATLVDLNEDIQIMEAGSLKWCEKGLEEMDCGNEG